MQTLLLVRAEPEGGCAEAQGTLSALVERKLEQVLPAAEGQASEGAVVRVVRGGRLCRVLLDDRAVAQLHELAGAGATAQQLLHLLTPLEGGADWCVVGRQHARPRLLFLAGFGLQHVGKVGDGLLSRHEHREEACLEGWCSRQVARLGHEQGSGGLRPPLAAEEDMPCRVRIHTHRWPQAQRGALGACQALNVGQRHTSDRLVVEVKHDLPLAQVSRHTHDVAELESAACIGQDLVAKRHLAVAAQDEELVLVGQPSDACAAGLGFLRCVFPATSPLLPAGEDAPVLDARS